MAKPRPLTWSRALGAYRQHLEAWRAAPPTLDGHLRELEHLRARVRPKRPDQVALTDLRGHQCGLFSGEGTRSGRPLAAATVAKISSILRAFFGFLRDEGLLATDPAARLERPRVPRGLPGDVLTVAEAKRLLAAPDRSTPLGLRDRALVDLMWTTGIRRNEARMVDLRDLGHHQGELLVRAGKGGKARVVPLIPQTCGTLTAYLERARPALLRPHVESSSALFLSARGLRLSNAGIWGVFKRLQAEAELTKRLTPHTLRRSFATSLLENGASLRHIQVLLGHASLDTTALYLRVDRSALRRELILRHPREGLDV